ncbi:MAG: protein tyrosine phosphatase [Sphingobacteriales bacterium]|nr:MAG: protein tyrosine phosphatase [Sphingobacteriales bacterium]
MKLLFICSRNQWRSPTAEAVFRNRPDLETRSAGTAASARTRVSEKHLRWADLVLVMEKRHRQFIQEQFPDCARNLNIVVLDIPDEYGYMDPELVAELEARVPPYFNAV